MSDSRSDAIREAAERALTIEQEVESAGEATLDAFDVDHAKASIHEWVDTIVGLVCAPGTGRVTLIHENGHESTVSSPDLPFLICRPPHWEGERMH